MKVLVACEESQRVCTAFIDLDENPFPPNLPWVDDDSLPNEDMRLDNEFIRITK